jgi:hypothetical protein
MLPAPVDALLLARFGAGILLVGFRAGFALAGLEGGGLEGAWAKVDTRVSL